MNTRSGKLKSYIAAGKSLMGKLLFPVGRCIVCNHPRTAEKDGICPACREQLLTHVIPAESCDRCLSRIPRGRACPFCSTGLFEGLDRQYAPFMYTGPVRNLVRALKFGHESLAASFLSRQMADSLMSADFDCIVPVPLHRIRQRERGYNQSALLAQGVSTLTGIPVREDLLTRVRYTKAQTSIAREQREQNVQGAFLASDVCRGLRILLLDDVRTGGSTGRACAAALREKGVQNVSLLTAAIVWTAGEKEKRKMNNLKSISN